MHLHIHLIPRYKGDVVNPKGGISKFKKNLLSMMDRSVHNTIGMCKDGRAT